MKKLIISFLFTFVLIIFIWTIMGYVQYGDELFTKHLDFKRSIENITEVFQFSVGDLLDSLEPLRELAAFDAKDYDFFETLELFFNSLVTVPVNVAIDVIGLLLDTIFAIFKFLFMPKFI